MKSVIAELEQASHAASKAMYEAGQASAAAGAPGSEAAGTAAKDDDILDAEFEEKS
jgi:molecular chaperone DnaK